MELIVKQGWTSTGVAGAMAAIEVPIAAIQYTFYVDCSTLVTSNSITLQAAQYSTGPWVTEASTQISTGNAAASTNYGMHITGPLAPFVRPFMGTAATGFYNLMLIGVG